jgi:lysophospholipase L1-like esterase
MTPDEIALLYFGGFGSPAEWDKPDTKWMTQAALRRALDAYNETLLNFCAETGSRCIDLARSMPKDKRLFYDDCHFSEAGAEAVADIVARGLRDN